MISRNLFFIVTWALLAPSLGWTQETSDRLLSTHISGGTYKDDSNGSLLSDFARENNVPIAVEPLVFDPIRGPVPHRVVELKNMSLREAVDRLLVAFPEYRWTLDDGVIIFSPSEGSDPVVSKILDTRINEVRVEKRKGSMSVGDYLFSLDALKKMLQTSGVKDVHFYNSVENMDFDGQSPPIFVFRGRTVREILNQLVKETTSKYWTITRWGARGEFVTISLY